MNHPHLEGLIPVAVEAFLASTGQAHTVTQLQRDLTTTCMRAALEAALAALPGGGVDWRDLFRFQTAMRYMDANDKLTRDKAYAMADEDIRRVEASPTPTPHEADRNG